MGVGALLSRRIRHRPPAGRRGVIQGEQTDEALAADQRAIEDIMLSSRSGCSEFPNLVVNTVYIKAGAWRAPTPAIQHDIQQGWELQSSCPVFNMISTSIGKFRASSPADQRDAHKGWGMQSNRYHRSTECQIRKG